MEGYGWFGAAYFIYDIWSMYKIHTQRFADKLLQKMINVTKDEQKTENSSLNNNLPSPVEATPAAQNGTTNKNGSLTFFVKSRTEFKEKRVAQQRDVNSFISYVITQPIMLFHHLFVGTVGFLVVTVNERTL